MIGGPIGKAIGEAYPYNLTFIQSVTANLAASTSMVKSAGKIVASLVSLTAIISTLRRHPGKPLMSKLANGKLSLWRGTR